MAHSTTTPISALQELTVRQNYALPVYDLVASKSGTHDNTFEIKVQVDDQFAIGVGKSKKEAKHNSAQIMLELLTNKGNHVKDTVVAVAQKLVPVNPVLETKLLDLLQTMTPVSALQEFAVKQNHPLPVYDLVDSQAGTHDNTFHYRVQVRDCFAIGIGKSKKEAKHNAAQNLLHALTNKSKNLTMKSHDATDISVKAPQTPPKFLLHEQFRPNFQQSLEYLSHDNNPRVQETNSVFPLETTTNSVGILQELTAKNKYPLPIYDMIYNKNRVQDDIFHYKVTVQADFAIGSGKTIKDAKQAAAKNLLDLYANKGKWQNDLQMSNNIFNLRELGENLPLAATQNVNNLVGMQDGVNKFRKCLVNLEKTEADTKDNFADFVDIKSQEAVKQSTVSPTKKCASSLLDPPLFQTKKFDPSQVTEDSTKTSISILQELTARERCPLPIYDLINCKTGTHDNSFNYQVQVRDYVAIGGGKSKKEAKHNAAQKLLDLIAEKKLYELQKPLDINYRPGYQSDLETQSNKHIVNTKLFSREVPHYSKDRSYPADVTRKHEHITVKSTKLFTTADTFNRIMDVLPELKETCQREDIEIMDRDMEAQEKYKLLFTHQKMNLTTNVCEFENQFKNAMKEKEVQLETIENYFRLPRTQATLQELLNVFEYTFSLEEMQDTPPISVLSIASDVPLMFMEMGDSLNEANAKVLDKAFTVLWTLMLG